MVELGRKAGILFGIGFLYHSSRHGDWGDWVVYIPAKDNSVDNGSTLKSLQNKLTCLSDGTLSFMIIQSL